MLLDHGHLHAWNYPLSMVFAEAKIVSDRINAHLAAETSLLQLALSSIPNQSVDNRQTRSTAKELRTTLRKMINGE